MRKFSFGNGDKRLSNITFEVYCRLNNSAILKIILSCIFSDDKTSTSNDCINCMSYRLNQYLSTECYKHQIIMNNNCLHNLAIIIIYNIDAEIIYSKNFSSLQDDMRFKGVKRTYSTGSDGKWIILATKVSKDIVAMFVDHLIESINALNTNTNKRIERYTKYNVNSTLVIYAAMLQ